MDVWGAEIDITRSDEQGFIQETIRLRNRRLFPDESFAWEEAHRLVSEQVRGMKEIWPNHKIISKVNTFPFEVASDSNTGFVFDSVKATGFDAKVTTDGGIVISKRV
jgi:hypothetical protein